MGFRISALGEAPCTNLEETQVHEYDIDLRLPGSSLLLQYIFHVGLDNAVPHQRSLRSAVALQTPSPEDLHLNGKFVSLRNAILSDCVLPAQKTRAFRIPP